MSDVPTEDTRTSIPSDDVKKEANVDVESQQDATARLDDTDKADNVSMTRSKHPERVVETSSEYAL